MDHDNADQLARRWHRTNGATTQSALGLRSVLRVVPEPVEWTLCPLGEGQPSQLVLLGEDAVFVGTADPQGGALTASVERLPTAACRHVQITVVDPESPRLEGMGDHMWRFDFAGSFALEFTARAPEDGNWQADSRSRIACSIARAIGWQIESPG